MDGLWVKFYEEEATFIEVLAGHIGDGLEAGDTWIVVATQIHRAWVGEGLKARGLRIAPDSTHGGRYIALDAAETLSQIMVQGWPDAERLAENYWTSTRVSRINR
jgi:lambda repressor-like predicted transcriptional regulator